jgi:hypothetical protein
MNQSLKDRFFASSVHLLFSALIAFALFCAFWFVIYPAPLFVAAGGVGIFLIMLGVDVIVGPLLTFAVFNKKKKSLRLDLLVIVIFQVIALIYGLSTLWGGRPVYVVSLGPRFDLIQASEIPIENLEYAKVNLPVWGPKWVATQKPTDAKRKQHITDSIFAGLDYGHFPELFVEMGSNRDEVMKFAEPVTNLVKYNAGREHQISEWFVKHDIDPSRVVFQGLKARAHDMTVLLDKNTGTVLGIAPFSPWP